VLFLAAVLLPSAVLVGTTLRLIRQQRELAVRRDREERSLSALHVGQELTGALRRLRERVGNAPLFPNDVRVLVDEEPALVTLALGDGAGLVFPWESVPDPYAGLAPEKLSEYRRLLETGEQAEYRTKDLDWAARLYKQAAEVVGASHQPGRVDEAPAQGDSGAPAPAEHLLAEARLRQARALLRAGKTDDARVVFRLLAESPPTLLDAEGIPFSVYGLEGLSRSGEEPSALLPLVDGTLEYLSCFSLPALLAWRDVSLSIAQSLEDGTADATVQAVGEAFTSRSAALEILEDLKRDFPALVATTRRGRGVGEEEWNPTWIPFGNEPWLVGILEANEEGVFSVPVVDPAVALARAAGPGRGEGGSDSATAADAELQQAMEYAQLLPAGDAAGESLGPALNGLRASFPPGFPPPSDVGGVEGWFFRLLLPLILILTGFTAYLAWRDVRREEEAIRLRSQFVSSVTHELKTPLTSIRMFVETIRLGRHASPEVQQEYLDTVVHETERLSRLINNVLDFARIERGEKTYHLALTDVGAAAREAAWAVAYPLAQGEYQLVTGIAPDLPRVAADADALTQALLNLLSNAIKFSPEGSRIDLRVLEEGDDLLLQVEDRGRGIAPQEREAIFQEFVRTADAEREGIPGTGLGLPLVAHVAEAHGGRVEVDSEVGHGSTFTLRIPVRGLAPEEDMTP
jgi:signal transduction histidine kinase